MQTPIAAFHVLSLAAGGWGWGRRPPRPRMHLWLHRSSRLRAPGALGRAASATITTCGTRLVPARKSGQQRTIAAAPACRMRTGEAKE